jgi:hypothetical protein
MDIIPMYSISVSDNNSRNTQACSLARRGYDFISGLLAPGLAGGNREGLQDLLTEREI